MRKNEDMMVVITETVEPGEKERESMEGAESQILLETGTVSSTWVSSATKADLAMREENFREASSQKEVSSEGWSVLEGEVVPLDDNDECFCKTLDCFFFCFEFELEEGIV